MAVTLTERGLQIGDQCVPVYSGALHYWRLERALWPTILDQVQALGFQMVETYIPWAIHETAPGIFDWGERDPRKNLEAFMRLCAERGLWLLVRPGPLINAELTDFGFPEWVLLDPAVQARSAVNSIHYDAAWGLHPPRQFPVPSYASEAFYTAVGHWFDHVCPIIARHLAPKNCVVAVQSDNETCYLFHDQAYATDYSPDSLALYHTFLYETYGSIAALNRVYRSAYADFAAVPPPRDCEVETRTDVPRHVDWVAYKEYQIRWAVARIARMLRERGIGDVPIFHDVAYQYRTPLDLSRMEADPDIDWVGMNLYRNQEGYRSGMHRMRFLAGATRLPFVPEFGCGLWSHHPQTTTSQEHELITLGALANGLKAFNLYMLVERERWQGSPITRHGSLRPDYAPFYRQLTTFLSAYELWRWERERNVLVLHSVDLDRFTALASTLHYAHVDLLALPSALFGVDLDLDFRWNPAIEGADEHPANWLHTLLRRLDQQHIAYDVADTHINAERLARYAQVFVQAVDFMDAADQARLVQYVEAGGHVLIGPGMPYLDPALQPCSVLAAYVDAPGSVKLGRGMITWIERPLNALDLDLICRKPSYRCDQPAFDLQVLRDGDRALLFVANPSAEAQAGRIEWAGAGTFRTAWPLPTAGTAPEHTEGALMVTLPPYTIRAWEVGGD